MNGAVSSRLEPNIVVIGVGPGDAAYLLPAAVDAAAACDVWVGGRRALDLLSAQANPPSKVWTIEGNIDDVLRKVAEASEDSKVAVLVSGDPLTYSLYHRLSHDFGPHKVRVIPGISSVHLALSRLGLEWKDVRICSAHGRNLDQFLGVASAGTPFITLTDPRNSPVFLAGVLSDRGMSDRPAVVLDSLGTESEEISRFDSVAELAGITEQSWRNALLFVAGSSNGSGPEDRALALRRLRDSDFARGEVPISKEEIRLLVASKLDPAPDAVCFDIGCGTGSVSIELARRVPKGHVYAIDASPEAQLLTRENIKRFGITNATIVPFAAPRALWELPEADVIFIGGSGADLAGILQACAGKLGDGGRLAATAVTLEKVASITSAAAAAGLKAEETLLVQISRATGVPAIFRGENPVYIFLFSKADPKGEDERQASLFSR